VIGTYESLIKPTRPIKELRDIVTYLTGFNLDDLATAPSREQVIEEIAPRFDDDTVVIGHNI
jgi:DNA polymerase III epsilon subunit-like protein